MVIIVAGNYQQYRRFVRELREKFISPPETRYACRPEDIMGVRDVEVLLVGTWWENPLSSNENWPYLKLVCAPSEIRYAEEVITMVQPRGSKVSY